MRIPLLQDPILCPPSLVPNTPNHIFSQSTFFTSNPPHTLPSPAAVRSAARFNPSPDGRRHLSNTGPPYWSPPPVAFPSLNLFVKWGANIRVEEGQTLYAIRYLLGHDDKSFGVPVPEIYGWQTDAGTGEVFLYMELVQGLTLESVWDTLSEEDRKSVCLQLGRCMANLRLLIQDAGDQFIGSIARSNIYDRAIGLQFTSSSAAAPFPSVKHFHNWFTSLSHRHAPNPSRLIPFPLRNDLPDDAEIRFTHGDLHRSNILVSKSDSISGWKLVAIVDWEQSGWFPYYWEDRKARWTADWNDEWTTRYLALVLTAYESTAEAWDWYISSLGN